jgi:CDP-diacylglycerol--glycerol-3-phosphate 3-phosphatidyltransferase
VSTSERNYGETALLTPANILTGFRLIITPIFIWLIFAKGASWWTTAIGLMAAASDYFDGIVARRHGTTTSGAFLDPLADKLVVLGSMWALVVKGPMNLVPVAIITARELWMTWYRSRASKENVSIPARPLAKWKTFAQDCAIGFCVLPPVAHLTWLQQATMWVAVALTLYTGWQYYVDGKRARVPS